MVTGERSTSGAAPSLPEVSLVVAIDAQTERIEPLRRMYPSALCVTSLDEVIDLIDAAIIATPPRSHAPWPSGCSPPAST